MPRMDGTGPDGKNNTSGRKLGICNENPDFSALGKGEGKRRKSGGGTGLGKRLKYDLKA